MPAPAPDSAFAKPSRRAMPAEHRTLQQAAEWFAVLRGEGASDADRQRWQAWLTAAPEHRLAWSKVEAVNAEFGLLPDQAARDALRRDGAQRRATVKKLLLLCIASGAGASALLRQDTRTYLAGWNAGMRTGVGEIRDTALADGGRLWLNTATALDIDYTPGLRRVALRHGEILVQSAPDTQQPPRPLVIDTHHGRLQALGTRFSVRCLDDSTELAVFEGAVQVEPAAGTPRRVVPAGQRLSFGADWIGAPSANRENGAAWTRRQLSPNQMRLDDFIAVLARYRHGHLDCAPEVGHLRLVGNFPLDDTDRILAVLEATLPVRVRRILPWWVSVGPAG